MSIIVAFQNSFPQHRNVNFFRKENRNWFVIASPIPNKEIADVKRKSPPTFLLKTRNERTCRISLLGRHQKAPIYLASWAERGRAKQLEIKGRKAKNGNRTQREEVCDSAPFENFYRNFSPDQEAGTRQDSSCQAQDTDQTIVVLPEACRFLLSNFHRLLAMVSSTFSEQSSILRQLFYRNHRFFSPIEHRNFNSELKWIL